MLNSKLINSDVAHYMFGYYAVRCINSNHFWQGMEKESPYWALFQHFAKCMKEFESGFSFENSKLRF